MKQSINEILIQLGNLFDFQKELTPSVALQDIQSDILSQQGEIIKANSINSEWAKPVVSHDKFHKLKNQEQIALKLREIAAILQEI